MRGQTADVATRSRTPLRVAPEPDSALGSSTQEGAGSGEEGSDIGPGIPEISALKS